MIRRFVVAAVLSAGLVPMSSAPANAEPANCRPPTGIAAPVATTPCAGVHPGARVTSPRGSCTLNFLFAGGDGKRYIGTAGHCILSSGATDTTWPVGAGPEAKVDNQRVGEFAYAVLDYTRDFALIRLDDTVPAWPEMTHFGGPTGIYTDRSLTPVVLHHYGHGTITGQYTKARSMVAPNTANIYGVAAIGTGLWGDSGSGVISSDGRAVGVLVTLGGFWLPSAGTNGISRLDYQLPFAQNHLGTTLTLQTAPLRPLVS